MPEPREITALLFDKDGTLFDFQKTWGPFGVRLVEQLAAGRPDLSRALADAVGVNLAAARYLPTSPVIAGSTRDVAEAIVALLPDWSVSDLMDWIDREAVSSGQASLAPAAKDLPSLLARLAEAEYALGVATNDSAASAAAQLETAGVRNRFGFIAGYDSVATPKPAPDMVHAFAAAIGAETSSIAMIGDSLHDLRAGRAAGCGAVLGVLSGPATAETLAPVADAVLPSIDDLPAWLGLSDLDL